MKTEAPLAASNARRSYGTRRTLDEALVTATISQEHILGPGKRRCLRSFAATIVLPTRQTLRSNVRGMTACSPGNRSLIAITLWGPPGTGKTTLACNAAHCR